MIGNITIAPRRNNIPAPLKIVLSEKAFLSAPAKDMETTIIPTNIGFSTPLTRPTMDVCDHFRIIVLIPI